MTGCSACQGPLIILEGLISSYLKGPIKKIPHFLAMDVNIRDPTDIYGRVISLTKHHYAEAVGGEKGFAEWNPWNVLSTYDSCKFRMGQKDSGELLSDCKAGVLN